MRESSPSVSTPRGVGGSGKCSGEVRKSRFSFFFTEEPFKENLDCKMFLPVSRPLFCVFINFVFCFLVCFVFQQKQGRGAGSGFFLLCFSFGGFYFGGGFGH